MDNTTNKCPVCQATFATPEELNSHSQTAHAAGQAPAAGGMDAPTAPIAGMTEPAAPMGGPSAPVAPEAPEGMGNPMGGAQAPVAEEAAPAEEEKPAA